MISTIVIFLLCIAVLLVWKRFDFRLPERMNNHPILLIIAISVLAFFLRGGNEPSGPVQMITAHEWMIDSIARDGKLTYRFNPERYDREQAKIYGYSFHSDGDLNSIETHISGGGQSPIGTHQFKKGVLIMEIDGRGMQLYRYRKQDDHLVLHNNERTVWLSPYSNRYMFGWSRNLFIPDSLQEK